ncbi:DUF2339 domain-containing protein [Motilimonas eburnea]|uniref:DUF2339 domain-containing protein n=1 Tax=Motilimonas eburnea TaxID=1737488 RepID=UPI001E55DFE2|nr:DUF2339 domain-containing protein [Motilimonas eburnea]MCE2572463.1 DUF2339 domain-containing protein [Motilimonas eburnea]
MKHLITALENELQALRHHQIDLAIRIDQAESKLANIKSEMVNANLEPNVTAAPVIAGVEQPQIKHVTPEPSKPAEVDTPIVEANTNITPQAAPIENPRPVATSTEHLSKKPKVVHSAAAQASTTVKIKQTSTAPTESLPQKMQKNALEQASNEWLDALLGPLAKVARQLKGFYSHYQQRGLGPVFLMTLAGIAALTLGFGYLLQYSWHHVFSDGMRIAVSVLFANSILAAGLWVYKKKPDMSEYGSGLVGLAIILNYLCAYFAGPYLGILGPLSSLIWLVAVTLAGYGLAQKLETKIVAVIALLGGAFSPLVFGVEQDYPALYLPYILLQALFAWRICQQLRWHGLLTLASMTHIASVEAFILLIDFHAQLDIWRSLFVLLSINLLFLLYTLTGIVKLRKLKLDQHLLAIPVAQLAFFILAMLQLDNWGGQVLALNSLLFLGLFAYWRKQDEVKHLCLVFAGVLAGFAATILVSTEFQGVIWSLEGALLLWLGLRHRYVGVRGEAYVLLVIGLLSTAYACVNLLLIPSEAIAPLFVFASFAVTAPWLNFAITLAIVHGCERLLHHYVAVAGADLGKAEQGVTRGLAELLSLLLALFVYFSCYIWLPDYLLVASILVIPMLLWRTTRQVLPATEILSWLAYLPLLIQILISVYQAHSWRFFEQDLQAQLARVGVFVLMWLSYRVYCRYLPSSSLLPVARAVNLLVYLAIPAYVTIKVGKVAGDWVALAAWLSMAIALTLDYWRKDKILRMEALLLFFFAVLLSVWQAADEGMWQGWLGLGLGCVMFAAIEHNVARCRARLRALAPLPELLKLTPAYFTLVVVALFCYSWHWPQHIALSLWGCALVVFALHAWLAHLWFRYQLLALVWSANIAMVVSLFAELPQGWLALGISLVVFSALRLRLTQWRGWLFRHHPLTLLRKSVPYYFSLVVAICVYVATKLPDALWFSLWGCAAFALALHLPIRHVLLRSLAMMLLVLASGYNFYLSLNDDVNGVLGLGIGLAAIMAYSYVYPSRQRYLTRFKPLAMAYPVKPYYMAMVGFATTYYVTDWLAPALLVAYYCLWQDLNHWPLHRPIRPSWRLALASVVMATLCLIGLHGAALYDPTLHGAPREILLLAIFDGLALLGLGKLLFYTPIKRVLRIHYLSLLLLWHGLFIAAYLLIGYSLGSEVYAPFSSVALVAHGSWLMMLSLQPQKQRLIRLASALFAFVFIKVIFWDMAGFALVQKVVAFMAIGGVLLLVSYFYLKQKNKQLAERPCVGPLSEMKSES